MTTVIDKYEKIINKSISLNVYGTFSEPLFKALEIGKLFEHTNIRKLVCSIPQEYKTKKKVITKGGLQNATFLTEPGLYYIIMRSDKKQAREFQKWVCIDVLPSLRKKGIYEIENKSIKHDITFKIFTEYDLQKKVIDFIRTKYIDALFNVSLGELQDTKDKRIQSHETGYTKGEPDLVINNLHKRFNGFVIEFKTPKGSGTLNKYQSSRLKKYRNNNYLTLVSNDYDNIIFQIMKYMNETRLKCPHCRGKFVSNKTLGNHLKYFHRIK